MALESVPTDETDYCGVPGVPKDLAETIAYEISMDIKPGRAGLRDWIKKANGRSGGIAIAITLLEALSFAPNCFSGDLRRDNPQVRDILEPITGIGIKTRQQILKASHLEHNRELRDLTSEERERLIEGLQVFF